MRKIIGERLTRSGLSISVNDFIDLPICEQRRYLQDKTGVKLRSVSSSPEIFGREQIESDLHYSLRRF